MNFHPSVQMSERYKERPELTWKCMNACAMEFPDESFDVAIDKGKAYMFLSCLPTYPDVLGHSPL